MTARDQKFYDIVAEEIRSRLVVDGVWVRCFSEAGGDDRKAKALYIAYRVEQLKAEEAAAKAAAIQRADAVRREKRERETEAFIQRPLTASEKRFVLAIFVILGLALFLIILSRPALTK